MSTDALPRIVGLTGGIASGKSTVSQIFRELGVVVIDADQVARDVVAPGSPGYAEIVSTFGNEVVLPDGSLNREALGNRVFADPAARAQLNAITHPRIGMEMMRQAEVAGSEGARWVIYDAALIVENGIHHALGGLIVVACSPQRQLDRIVERDHLSREAAQRRLDAQMPLEAKIAVADWVIDNNGSLSDTKAQVLNVFHQIQEST